MTRKQSLLALTAAALLSGGFARAEDGGMQWGENCTFYNADGSVYAGYKSYVCDFLKTENPTAQADFAAKSPSQQQAFLKSGGSRAESAYQKYLTEKRQLLAQTDPGALTSGSAAANLGKINDAENLLKQKADEAAAPFAAGGGTYTQDFHDRETLLEQKAQEARGGLDKETAAESDKAAAKFADSADNKSAPSALNRTGQAVTGSGGDADAEHLGQLFDNKGVSGAKPGSKSGDALVGNGAETGGALHASDWRGAAGMDKNAVPETASDKPQSYHDFMMKKADEAQDETTHHIMAASDPDAPWYSRAYHNTAAYGDALKGSLYEFGSGDPAPWKESGAAVKAKGNEWIAEADAQGGPDGNGGGVSRALKEGAGKAMVMTGTIGENAPELAHKAVEFGKTTASCVGFDGAACKEVGGTTWTVAKDTVKGLGEDLSKVKVNTGKFASSPTMYSGAVMIGSIANVGSNFVAPEKGAIAEVGVRTVERAAAEDAVKLGAREAASTAAKDTAVTAARDGAEAMAAPRGAKYYKGYVEDFRTKDPNAVAQKLLAENPHPQDRAEMIERLQQQSRDFRTASRDDFPAANKTDKIIERLKAGDAEAAAGAAASETAAASEARAASRVGTVSQNGAHTYSNPGNGLLSDKNASLSDATKKELRSISPEEMRASAANPNGAAGAVQERANRVGAQAEALENRIEAIRAQGRTTTDSATLKRLGDERTALQAQANELRRQQTELGRAAWNASNLKTWETP